MKLREFVARIFNEHSSKDMDRDVVGMIIFMDDAETMINEVCAIAEREGLTNDRAALKSELIKEMEQYAEKLMTAVQNLSHETLLKMFEQNLAKIANSQGLTADNTMGDNTIPAGGEGSGS